MHCRSREVVADARWVMPRSEREGHAANGHQGRLRMPDVEDHWNSWRGSSQQLMHVFDVAVEVATDEGSAVPKCEITIEVDDDREGYRSPDEFYQKASEETLASFDAIRCAVTGPSIDVRFDMAWEGPRLIPDRSATITLHVSGPDSQRVDKAARASRAAIKRSAAGHWRHFWKSRAIELAVTVPVVFVSGLAAALLGLKSFTSVRGFICLAIALVVGWYIEGLLYPDLEVTVTGKTSRLKRLRNWFWGITLALATGLLGGWLKDVIFG